MLVRHFTLQAADNAAPPASQETPWGMRLHPVAILLVALLLRLFVLWFVMARMAPGWFFSHGIELGILADSLQAGHGLSSPFGGSTGPTALLAPGYPACIALLFRIFGSFTPAAAIAIMTMQLWFTLATVLLIMRIAQRCFGSRAANIGGAFWAVSLPLIWMPAIFWETCLSTLLLLSMIGLALRFRGTTGLRVWGLMGAYVALASLVNPALLLSLLAILGWAAWPSRKAFWHLPFALLMLAAVFAPWPIRNARVLHAFIPLRSTVGFELWMGNRTAATGFLEESQFPSFNRFELQQYVAAGEAAYIANKTALAAAYVRAHPGMFVTRSAVRCFRFWMGTGTQHGSLLFPLHAALTSVLGWFGMWRLLRERRWRLAALLILPLIAFPLPYYITHAEFRYRLVIDPLLTILAAHAVCGPQPRRVLA
jgi:hypothetical protein